MPKKTSGAPKKKVAKKTTRGPKVKTHILAEKVKTYFYERKDGTVFACSEKEAWAAHKKFKQVGVSDGAIYAAMVRDVQIKGTVTETEAREVLAKAFDAELKVARGNFQSPPDPSLETFGQRPISSSSVQNLVSRR